MAEEKITIIRCDDGTIWVTSEQNPIGVEVNFSDMPDDGRQELAALAIFLGIDPSSTFCFDDLPSFSCQQKYG